jgi:hypothetical protein
MVRVILAIPNAVVHRSPLPDLSSEPNLPGRTKGKSSLNELHRSRVTFREGEIRRWGVIWHDDELVKF